MNVTPTRRGDGIVRCQDGSFTGDGTAVTINLGFIPTFFQLINLTDAVVWEKLRGMGATQSLKVVTAGTTTVDTTSAIVLNNDGTVTISAAANVSAKSFVFVAQG
jgi:hypothetical protein